MLSHLVFPYQWVTCSSAETCEKPAHLDESPEALNSYPMEWVAALLGCSFLNSAQVEWWDETGILHREGSAAREDSSGKLWWYVNGRLHREDGPAIIHGDSMSWYRYGLKHRTDGPAVVKQGEDPQWWTNGVRFPQTEELKLLRQFNWTSKTLSL